MELSPVLLRELRKAKAASKKKKELASTVSTGGAVDEATTALDQPNVCKRKAEKLSSADCTDEPASLRTATGHLFEEGPEVQGTTGELAAQKSWQLGSAEGRLAYATMVGVAASLQKPSWPHKSTANGSASAETAASPEAAIRRMSLEDMSGPLCGMPDGNTPNAQVATNSAAPIGERPNKTPIFISGVGDSRAFLAWLRASCPGGLTAQLKSEKLMVAPSTADGFRAAVSALWSLDGGKGVSFHTFTLPENRCVRPLVKNLGRVMPESVARDELESLNIRVQGVTQQRSCRRNQDPAKDRLPTPPLHCFSGATTRGVKGTIYDRTLRLSSVGGIVRGPEGPTAMQALSALWT
jgi:hypothetical protein